MDLLKQIVARAQSDKQRIVLPEAEEERTLKAADRALQDGLADIILIGNPENIRKEAEEWGLKNIDKATIVDPKNNPRCEEYAEKLAELRKKKGMTIEQARKLVTENNLYLGCMIIKTEGADGQISGALSTTGETLRPALQIIKCAPGISCVSGAMLLLTHEKAMGNDGVIVMGDVAVTPNPTADQLAQIAYTTAQTAHSVAGMTEPYIAMLSYSTKGSAKDAINKETGKSVYVIDKVKDAVSIAHEKYPGRRSPRARRGYEEGAGKLGGWQGQRARCAQPRGGQHRLQTRAASGWCRGYRPDPPGYRTSGQRPQPWLLGR